MGDYAHMIVLAVLQGITEFLPISSDGHLAVCENLFGITEGGLLVTIVLHAGSLNAIAVYYFMELLSLLRPEKWKAILLLFVGTIPAGVIGVLLKKTGVADQLNSSMLAAGLGFLATGSVLLWGAKRKLADQTRPYTSLSIGEAVWIGFAQAVAILPGVSRSGCTISTGLRRGLNGVEAASFSFLLAVPAIGGATFLQLLDVVKAVKKGADPLQGLAFAPLALGFVISAVVSYFALAVLIKVLKKGKLAVFSYYCLTLGTVVTVWGLWIIAHR